MFDAVLDRGNDSRRSRFGIGAALSILLHVGLLMGVVWFPTAPAAHRERDVSVKFMVVPSPPPPPPPLAPPVGKSTPKVERVEHKRVRRTESVIQPKTVTHRPPDPHPEEEGPTNGAKGGVKGGIAGGVVEGGVAGGVIGGTVGGTLGGQVGGQLKTEVLPFGEGMTRPERIEGRDPQYTREALAAHVGGMTIVRCVITVEGRIENCRMIKPLPYMEKAVLDAVSTWRYKPVLFQGKPVSVEYVFNIRLVPR